MLFVAKQSGDKAAIQETGAYETASETESVTENSGEMTETYVTENETETESETARETETEETEAYLWHTEDPIPGSDTGDEYTETPVKGEASPAPEDAYDNYDAVLIAKTIAVEAPHCTTMEQAAVAWCILNRVDSDTYPDTVYGNVSITSPRQFGYYPWTPVRDDLYDLAVDVLERWEREKAGESDVGRVLPSEYLYFWGDLVAHNYFTVTERAAEHWQWLLPNPYEEVAG